MKKIDDEKRFRQIMERSGVPKLYVQDLINLYPSKFKKVNFPKDRNLFFWGLPGTGKTVRALAAVLDMFQSQKRINPDKFMFGQPAKILFEVKQTYSKFYTPIDESESIYEEDVELPPHYDSRKTPEENIIRKYTEPDILLLDDMGAENTTDYSISILYLIVNRRYENMKVTYTTSNYNPEELIKATEDGRIVSRLLAKAKIYELKDQRRN